MKLRFTGFLWLVALAVWAGTPSPADASPAPADVAVINSEGTAHGFLTLKSLDGKLLADGEATQVANHDRLTSHLTFRFVDGSLYDDTTVFAQDGKFRLVSDHLIERGPAFPFATETTIDRRKGQVTVRYADDDSKEQTIERHMDLPENLGNGLLFTLLGQLTAHPAQAIVPWLGTSPKPHLVDFVITPLGQEPLDHGTIKVQMEHYRIHVRIKGFLGVIARMIGKQPPDMQIWVLSGPAPSFVKFEGPLTSDGPVYRIELAAPAAK